MLCQFFETVKSVYLSLLYTAKMYALRNYECVIMSVRKGAMTSAWKCKKPTRREAYIALQTP